MKQAIPDLARRPDIKALFALYDEQPRAPGCPSPGQLCPEQHEAELTRFCRQHGKTFLAGLLRGGLSLDFISTHGRDHARIMDNQIARL